MRPRRPRHAGLVARPKIEPRVWLALATVYVVWGSTYLGIDFAIRTIPPFLMAATRFLAAGVLLYAWSIRRGDRRRLDGAGNERRSRLGRRRSGNRADRPTVRHWLSAFLIAAPMLAVGNAAVAWAEQTLDTGTASLIIASVPLWMALLDRVVCAQRLASAAVLGLVIGFGGVGLLVAPGGASGAGSRAAIVLVFSSLAWAIGSLYSRRAQLPSRPLVGVAMQMLAGGAILTVVAAARGELGAVHPEAISLESWLGLAYLVAVGSLLGFTTYMWLLRAAPTSLVGTYAYVNPVVAVLLGTLLLGEPLTWRTLVGGGIIVASVALIVGAPRPAPRTAVEGRAAATAARAR
jgi:drug/metabolite transporter (DMT)-like permease